MLIDIDIKIEDSDGNLLNCFEKQFQEETDCLIRPENSVNFGKSFEDFLSEYLSESGHIVRNKLLYNCTGCSDTPDLCESSAEDAASDNASATNFESGEMEYKIQIGRHSVISGKIPLALSAAQAKTMYNGIKNNHRISYHNKINRQGASLFMNQKTAPQFGKDAALDTLVDYAMKRAIEKYESNLYPIDKEEEYDFIFPD